MREFPDYFADAESDFKNARYVIFGVPFDGTSTFRYGSKDAPAEIRKASWNFESFHMETENDLSTVPVHDYGDIQVEDEPEKVVKRVEGFVCKLSGKIPVAIGGEHTISCGVVRALKKRDIAVILLDAHLDFRDSYEGIRYSHACVARRIAEEIGIDNLVILGVRSAGKEEYMEAKEMGLFFVDAFRIKKEGVERVIHQIMERFGERKFYLSLDMDVLDPSFAPGVSTPEPFGLSTSDVKKCIESLSPSITGFDVVEVCPKYDYGITSVLAAKFIRIAIDRSWSSIKP